MMTASLPMDENANSENYRTLLECARQSRKREISLHGKAGVDGSFTTSRRFAA